MAIYGPIREFVKVINEPVDVNLEMAHIAYAEAKKDNPQILLFTNPVDRGLNKTYDMPVLMNLFANHDVVNRIFGASPLEIAQRIEKMHMAPPERIRDTIKLLKMISRLKNSIPKRVDAPGRCHETAIESLDELPILKSWPKDGGKFITMGQVYTKSLDGKVENVGMYRLQVMDKMELAMHWQVHKDGSKIFEQYRRAGKPMPVSIAVGGDPLFSWCSTAPAPYGLFEVLFYGFIRNKRPLLVKSLTNDIYVPADADIVIEGVVYPDEFVDEGPFGDHTGYYTPVEKYPLMHVKSITARKDAIYYATVVGKPPLEDKYMGYATERIFLPLIKASSPELVDYKMPENGVFHNLILCRIRPAYPGDSLKILHALWGVGQMSFVKHAIFVDENAPSFGDWENFARYVLDRLDPSNILISRGVVDALDHSSPSPLIGGKLGVDATGEPVEKRIETLSDEELLERLKSIDDRFLGVKQYCTESANPICVISVKKNEPMKVLFERLKALEKFISIAVFVDADGNDLSNPYMLIWRVTNNIDAERDVWLEEIIGIDATKKGALDGYEREWPDEVVCDRKTFESLKERGLIDLDDKLVSYYQLL